MPCFKPLWAIKNPGDTRYSVKPRFSNVKEKGKALELGGYMPYVDFDTGELIEPVQIPCGKCLGCRLDYSRQWANRCVLESQCYKSGECSFLTLSYDEHNVPWSDDGCLYTLKPKDIQDFIKRFRMRVFREFGKEVRFFLCGEYGDAEDGQIPRPHYHVLLFGFEFFDKKYKGLSKSGEPVFISKYLDEIWGKGYTWIGELNWQTCAYTARYVMKKQKGKEAGAYYQKKGIVPEFVRMSLKPGIGAEYYNLHKDEIYKNDEIVVPNGDVVITSKPPPYFDSLLERENPELLARIKSARKLFNEESNQIEVELAQTDLDAAGYFELKERQAEQKAKQLKRSYQGGNEDETF